MLPTSIPYIQDIAGSIEHCPVAVSPAMCVRNALAELSCCYNKDGELTEIKLLDRSRLDEERKEYKHFVSDLGELEIVYSYDEKGRQVDRPVRYKDTFDESGHLKKRKYTKLKEVEKYSHIDSCQQVIRLERVFERIELIKEYQEFYNDDFKLVSQSYRAYDLHNPMNIQEYTLLVHYYHGLYIYETIQTYVDRYISFGVTRYVYSKYRRSNWGKVEIFHRERNDEREELFQTIEREFAFKQEEIAALYDKYNALKVKIPTKLPF